MKRIKPFLPAISIFCLALLVRIAYNLTVARNYYPTHDSGGYRDIAYHLLNDHCYCWLPPLGDKTPAIVSVSHAPLWPFIIAGLSLIVGNANISDRLFLCCADAGTCVLIYLFARDLFNKRIGLVAGLIACVYPALYIYTGWMYTEALFTFLQFAVCYCVFRIQRDEGKSRRLWILCGVLMGLASLTHPNGVVLVGLVILWAVFLVWRKHLQRRALLNVALATLIACAMIAPWTIRNYLVSHSFVLVASGDGSLLLGVYNDEVMATKGRSGWIGPGTAVPQVLAPFANGPCAAPCEVAREKVERDAAIQWIKSHLNEMPLMLSYHLRSFFTPYTREVDMPMDRFPHQRSSKIVRAMSETFPIPIFMLAALGLVVTLRRYWRKLFFAYLVVLSILAEILVFYGNARFRSPIEPILILLTAGAIWWLTHTEPGTLNWMVSRRGQDQQSTTTTAEPSSEGTVTGLAHD